MKHNYFPFTPEKTSTYCTVSEFMVRAYSNKDLNFLVKYALTQEL